MMVTNQGLNQLPTGLPEPANDGAAAHLPGMMLPSVCLPSTAGGEVCLAERTARRTVVYCYPMTGKPGEALPEGWDEIPGARGCTPQSCSFRDHHRELAALGAEVFGVSTQTTAEQREAGERLHLPFELLSDAGLELARALRLPTFEAAGMARLRRLTLVVAHGRVEKVFYPVFPPDRNAPDVLAWLGANR